MFPLKRFLLIIFFLPLAICAQYSIPASERSVLIDLYNQTNGPEWAVQWDFTQDPQKWYGITVQNGRVTGIGLSGVLLSGTVPSSLSSLSALRNLDLSSNRISGNLSFLSAFHELQVLNLNDDDFQGDVSNTFAGLSTLQELSINNTKLTISDLSGFIGGLNQLQRLEIAGVGIKNLPVNLNQMTQLAHLDLSHDSIQNPEVLSSLSALQELKMNGSGLKKIPAAISGLKTLTFLELNDNQISDFTSLAPLTSLITFSIKNNGLTQIPPQVSGLLGLQDLFLSFNQITEGLANLSSLKDLQILWVDNNHLEGAFPSEVINLPALQFLNLSGNNLSGPLPAALPEITDISNNRFVAADLIAFFNGDQGKTIINFSPQRYDDPVVISTPLGSEARLTQSLSSSDGYEFMWLKNLGDDIQIDTPDYTISPTKDSDYTKYTVEAFLEQDTPAGLFQASFFREPIALSLSLGTDDPSLEGIAIYPNPTSDFLNIRSTKEKVTEAKLFDMSGKIILTQRNPTQLNLSHLPSAMYILSVTTVKGVRQFKVVKH